MNLITQTINLSGELFQVTNNRHIIFSKFRDFFEINRFIILTNGKTQYFVKG